MKTFLKIIYIVFACLSTHYLIVDTSDAGVLFSTFLGCLTGVVHGMFAETIFRDIDHWASSTRYRIIKINDSFYIQKKTFTRWQLLTRDTFLRDGDTHTEKIKFDSVESARAHVEALCKPAFEIIEEL